MRFFFFFCLQGGGVICSVLADASVCQKTLQQEILLPDFACSLLPTENE